MVCGWGSKGCLAGSVPGTAGTRAAAMGTVPRLPWSPGEGSAGFREGPWCSLACSPVVQEGVPVAVRAGRAAAGGVRARVPGAAPPRRAGGGRGRGQGRARLREGRVPAQVRETLRGPAMAGAEVREQVPPPRRGGGGGERGRARARVSGALPRRGLAGEAALPEGVPVPGAWGQQPLPVHVLEAVRAPRRRG
jgi:hypothetical protein